MKVSIFNSGWGVVKREGSASICQPLNSSAPRSPRVLPKPLRVLNDLVLSHVFISWDFKGEELKGINIRVLVLRMISAYNHSHTKWNLPFDK